MEALYDKMGKHPKTRHPYLVAVLKRQSLNVQAFPSQRREDARSAIVKAHPDTIDLDERGRISGLKQSPFMYHLCKDSAWADIIGRGFYSEHINPTT